MWTNSKKKYITEGFWEFGDVHNEGPEQVHDDHGTCARQDEE